MTGRAVRSGAVEAITGAGRFNGIKGVLVEMVVRAAGLPQSTVLDVLGDVVVAIFVSPPAPPNRVHSGN